MKKRPEVCGSDENIRENISPGMRQYQKIKARYMDAILFFHIGDFYETFGSDAELISRELDLVLTSRSKGNEGRVPLAGVPYHAADSYIARLVAKGYKVAVCDQLEDAKKAKGIVKRDVVRVITPGTVIDPSMLPSSDARYLMALCPGTGGADWGLAFLDISTGEFFVSIIPPDNPLQDIISEVVRYRPAECIIPANVPKTISSAIADRGVVVHTFRDDAFDTEQAGQVLLDQFHVLSLAGYGCESIPAALGAAAAALGYAKETQQSSLEYVRGLSTRTTAHCMLLDAVTLRNLEITESIRPATRGNTLLSCLNKTKTPMGNRLLRFRLTRPLIDTDEINARLDSVEFWVKNPTKRHILRAGLASLADLQRIAARIAYGNAGPRDLIALASTLRKIPEIRDQIGSEETDIPSLIAQAKNRLHPVPETATLIERAIIDDPPATPRNGGVIREGYSRELDELRGVLREGRDWIAGLQNREREKTGIKSLKIGYNRIFGYYIDVTRPNLPLVPDYYERKQTTATGERYTLPELREKETLLNNADERLLSLERDLYTSLLDILKNVVPEIQETALGIAELDLYSALAETAKAGGYIRPLVNNRDSIVIRDGRHPVVERSSPAGFVPNDTDLSGSGTRIMIITGANMAGKSTYMRAVALICIMAQAGSFVPARHAEIGVIDRIFTRVGAFDDLASGQSTFMVEMLELANILNNVTVKSLVILDEIGRGTSTIDGYAIARSVLEYLHGKSPVAGPKTLFATHFHELVNVEHELKQVRNFHFAVRETKDEVIFLRRLIPGATDRSYGIHVARLAGIPKKVTDRADTVLLQALDGTSNQGSRVQRYTQLLISDDAPQAQKPTPSHPVLEELRRLNPESMTPVQALVKLHELRSNLDKEGENP
ncbi:MAG: DNA-binding protein MutS2 [Methanoregula sp. PtaU1.Bin051]|nr:MAG: DNA-binding protein MutS2 [Methanoregula sp. PtaU1.Bin051]